MSAEFSVRTHVYPFPLQPSDQLTDGPNGVAFELLQENLLIWVDLHPDHRFVHPTRYILISADRDLRVEEGEGFPMLNGEPIVHPSESQLSLDSPFSPLRENPSGSGRRVDIYSYPFALTPRDRLADGPRSTPFKLADDTFLIWLDLLPPAKFGHPTAYILIGADKTVRVEKGNERPHLNGKMILYGNAGYDTVFPFGVRSKTG